MKRMKWLEQRKKKTGMMDTYMDTCEQSNNDNPYMPLKSWWARLDLNQLPDDYESVHSILCWIPPSNIN